MRHLLTLILGSLAPLVACAQGAEPATAPMPVLAPLAGVGARPNPPWGYAGLPDQKPPATRYDIVELDGRRVLRVRAEASYGNLVHPLQAPAGEGGGGSALAAPSPAVPDGPLWLAWRWRVEQPLQEAAPAPQAGDGPALRGGGLSPLPLDALPFWERQKMRLARSVSGQHLPAATLCYVWDPRLPPGTVLPNAHSPRLRWWVLRGPESAPGQWLAERRDLRADVLRAFGDETRTLPPLLAIGLGADADNSGGRSLGYVDALTLGP